MEKSDPFLYPMPDLSIAFSRVLVNLPKTGGGKSNIKVGLKCRYNTVAAFLARKTSMKTGESCYYLFFKCYFISLFLGRLVQRRDDYAA